MSREVTNVREKVAGHQVLVAADSTAHQPLANTLARLARPAKAPQPLLRVPRSSLPPPLPESRTTLTPAPIFDEDVELLEDSGLLKLDPEAEMVEEMAEELSARFLIDDSAGEVILTPAIASSTGSEQLEAMDEMDSEHLAFVETQGEIDGRAQHLRPLSEGPKIRLLSLHEQALAEGLALYSDGVPSHNLQQSGQISKTLRIHASHSPARPSLWRHVSVLMVFAAGIGAGVFFATQNQAKPQKALAAAEASEPLHASAVAGAQSQQEEPAAEVLPLDPVPVVMPLVEEEIAVQELAAESASGDRDIPSAELDEPSANDADDGTELVANEEAPTPAPAKSPRSKARPHTSETSDSASSNQAINGSADPGVLMLAAKPPCGILIDGKDTGLMTPQRVLHLAPGKHKVTLVNEEHGLKDSFHVSIRSGEKTKVIRDNTSKIK